MSETEKYEINIYGYLLCGRNQKQMRATRGQTDKKLHITGMDHFVL